jgi:hypothetical protein
LLKANPTLPALDRFILALRTLAPRFLGKAANVPAESIEAVAVSNVTDGVLLVQKFTGKLPGWNAAGVRAQLDKPPSDNPYLSKPWARTTEAEWTALSACITDAAQALESASSLLLAESVHQLVQGNTARASAALDAAGTGDAIAPIPEFVASPADGYPVSHSLLIVAAGGGSWAPARPRAMAEPGLEGWVASRLGNLSSIVLALDAQGAPITVASSELCALDFVYEAANRAGLEQRLRASIPTLSPTTPLAETRVAGWQAGWRAFGDVFQLAAAIRSVLVSSRPATASDLALPNAWGAGAPPTREISGAALAEAHRRAQAAHDLLKLRTDALAGLLSQATVPTAVLSTALEALAAFGIVAPMVAGERATALAQLVLADATRRLSQAEAALKEQQPSASGIQAAGEAVFGTGFWILPSISPVGGADGWDGALATPPAGASVLAVRSFLADSASVRDGVRRYQEMLLLSEAVGEPAPLRVAQLTGAGALAPNGWIGGLLSQADPTPDVPVTSIALDVASAYGPAHPTIALVVDQWVEVLPVRERRGQVPDVTVDARRTTGIAFNAIAPLSRAPQALLLAIPPDTQRWTTARVTEVLEDTLDLAKIRLVTLEDTNGVARVLPALYEQSWSLQGEKAFDLGTTLLHAADKSAILQFIKDPVP